MPKSALEGGRPKRLAPAPLYGAQLSGRPTGDGGCIALPLSSSSDSSSEYSSAEPTPGAFESRNAEGQGVRP
jgi:hypothetical protein